MPVAVKLSRKFYDRFGEEIVNEFVDVINQIDASYRSELRDMNELNWGRFEAKLEQRVAELRADIERGFKEQTRWMFLVWSSLLIPIIGLWMRG